MRQPGFRVSGLAIGLLSLFLAAPVRAEGILTCPTLPSLIRTFLSHHIQQRSLTKSVQSRAIDVYVDRLDSSKTLLLESDAKTMKEDLTPIFKEIHRGRCGRLDDLRKRIVTRLEATEAFVRETMGKDDYAVDPGITLVVDPDRRGYAKTEQERLELTLGFVHFQMSNYLSAGSELSEAKEKLIHRYELMIRRVAEQTNEDLYARFLDAFASSLDPHTSYFSRDALEDFQIGVSLSLEGIGVALSSQDGYSVVEKVIPGGATDRMGDVLHPKDKIIAVAQDHGEVVDVIDMALRDVVRLIRGRRGTKVTLTVLRQEEATERFDLTIERDKIDLEEQAAKLRFIEHPVGDETLKLAILELPSFYGDNDRSKRQCAKDVERLLGEVKREKADGLLLDIATNGGGILDHAVQISGFFVKSGGIVAVQDGKEKVQVLRDPDDGILFAGPMVVLTSRLSASGSEILAGALKDYRRAIIVGDDHTFGKGTVQSVISLPPGLGALKVTTAVFFRPGGRSTQNSGVDAHVVTPSVFATDEVGEISQPYALASRTIRSFLESRDLENGGEPAWTPVSPEAVTFLAERSRERVESSEDFQKLREQMEKSAAHQGIIHLDEILKEREEAKEESAEAEAPDKPSSAEANEEADDEDALTPQAEEALQVLADYVAMTSSLQVADQP